MKRVSKRRLVLARRISASWLSIQGYDVQDSSCSFRSGQNRLHLTFAIVKEVRRTANDVDKSLDPIRYW